MSDREHFVWAALMLGMFAIGGLVGLRYVEDRCALKGHVSLPRSNIKCEVVKP